MTFEDRLRRELQEAIPSDPPLDPAALADELIRRAEAGPSGDGGRGGPGGGRIAMWLLGLAIVGGAIGAAVGFSGVLGTSSPTTADVAVVVTTTAPPVASTTVPVTASTTIPAAPSTSAAPVESTTAPVTTGSTVPPTAPTTEPDTSPPFVGQPSVATDPIWELDTEGILCGVNPRQSTVTVGVSDDRGVASVTLSWQFPGGPSGSTAMSGSGTYAATVGPFPYLTVPDNTSQVAALTVTAVDAVGNAASAPSSITVFSTSTCFG